MVIIDASVMNKIFLPNEEGYDLALKIIDNHLQNLEEILIPDLLFYEVTNTLVTKSAIPIDKIIKSVEQLDDLNLIVIHPKLKELTKIAKFASIYGTSVYDATYAVLAKEKSCELFSADSKFVNKVKLHFVKHLSEYSSNIN